MKNCSIIVNGFYTNPSIEYQTSTLVREFDHLGVAASVLKSGDFDVYLGGKDAFCGVKGDFIVYLDKDVHTALMLEKGGFRLFNSANAIAVCDDKMLTHVALLGSGINMPVTVSSPLNYYGEDGGSFLETVEKIIDYPVVVKEVYGSMGAGVFLAKNRSELIALREKLIKKPHIYQQFIGEGGEDIRVIVIGGKAVAAMKRKNASDFRSNVSRGGSGFPVDLDDEVRFIAEKSAETLGLDYGGIDVLRGKEGTYYFCEANSNAFWSGIEKVSGVNVARLYSEHIYRKIYRI